MFFVFQVFHVMLVVACPVLYLMARRSTVSPTVSAAAAVGSLCAAAVSCLFAAVTAFLAILGDDSDVVLLMVCNVVAALLFMALNTRIIFIRIRANKRSVPPA